MQSCVSVHFHLCLPLAALLLRTSLLLLAYPFCASQDPYCGFQGMPSLPRHCWISQTYAVQIILAIFAFVHCMHALLHCSALGEGLANK
jgi:hypothetical protein